MASTSDPKADLPPATYAELYNLDNTFESIDAVTAAFQEALSQPLFKKRAAVAERIPNFWPLVFEQSPQDVDQYIQPSDSNVLTNYLTGFSVDRFESKASPESISSLLKGGKEEIDEEQFGEPRSVKFRFEFKENEYFEDKVLEKKFWYRRSIEGEGDDAALWAGRVSEPVRIHWKAGKDLSEGLTDAACALWEAQKKNGLLDAQDYDDGKTKTEQVKKLPEYTTLMDKVDGSSEGSQSFFTWFSYHGPWVSDIQDKLARTHEKTQRDNIAKQDQQSNGAKKEDHDDDDDVEDLSEMPAHLAVEVFPDGEELALALAEDVWPNAIKQFLEAQDVDDDDVDMSEGSFDEADLEDLDEEAVGKANLEEIRGLSGRMKKEETKEVPPAKKRKT